MLTSAGGGGMTMLTDLGTFSSTPGILELQSRQTAKLKSRHLFNRNSYLFCTFAL